MINKYIEVGDKIEIICRSSGGQETYSYYTNIQDIVSDEELLALAPIEKGEIIPLVKNEEYYLCFYTKRGLFRCDAILLERDKSSGIPLIKFRVISKIKKIQRRKYYRLDCLLTFQYKDEVNDVWQQGIILDISGGGIRFTSNGKQRENSQVVCHVQLMMNDDSKHIYISGNVIESVALDDNSYTYENRVIFESISNEVREMIIKFIFEEERKRRKLS